ncbi:MAG: lipopolysaccharide heptosyltransferase I [Desulfuromonadaceae bacterium]|nr:lipopolysaccharide heptosyltransferase I [Desulfuromonadaceae bacterium]MDD2854299.1 lipopolysaccharide heptosyltransferase I [Desulfuromonadaceae bacterium]
MRILIVKLSALGDIIHALPVLDYLRQAVPGTEIDWVLEEQNRTILEGHPLIREVVCIKTRSWRKSPLSATTRREVGAVIRRLRSASYDLVFDLQGNTKSGIVTALTGASQRYGFDRDAVRESLNLAFTNHKVPLRPEDFHISSRSLRVVSSAFGENYSSYSLKSHIETSDEDNQRARKLLENNSGSVHLLFHTGTTWETKKWSVDAWFELAQQLLENFPQVNILFSWGNEQELNEVQTLASKLGERSQLLPRLDLKTFCALIKQVDVVVGGDTGPIHIAAATGTPTVSFYRATDARRNGPRGASDITIQSGMSCSICLNRTCPRDDECRQSIRTDDIFGAVESVIRSIPDHRC